MTPSMLTLTTPDSDFVPHPHAEAMLPGIGGFPISDRMLFLAGYSELCRVDLAGRRVLEICGGDGKLSVALAEGFPKAEVIALDLYKADGGALANRAKQLRGLSFMAGNAFDLGAFEDQSLDLVFGQAALHHLAHDAEGISREVYRVLKPGGRFVFIFEPMGHNLLVAAIRAVRMAREELGDESNLYLSQFERMMNVGYASCEVQMFNILGYPMKAFSDRFAGICRVVQKADGFLMRTFPRLKRYGANANIIFTK